METRSHGDGGCTASSTSPDRPQPSLSADPVWAGASACQPLLRTFSDLAPSGAMIWGSVWSFRLLGERCPRPAGLTAQILQSPPHTPSPLPLACRLLP